MKNSGFTLIEVIIYFALFSLILSSVTVAVYAIVQTGSRSQGYTNLQNEGDFILAKLNWALEDASSTAVSGSQLLIYKNSYDQNPIAFNFADDDIKLAQGIGQPLGLNSNLVKAENFSVQALAGGSQPPGITITFRLETVSSYEQTLHQDFNLTRYLQR